MTPASIPDLVVLNCSHALSQASVVRIAELCSAGSVRVLPVHGLGHLDLTVPLPCQVRTALDALGWPSAAWESMPYVVVLPSMAMAAALVIAELHARSGHFPDVVQVLQIPGPPTRYEAHAVLALQQVRDDARRATRSRDAQAARAGDEPISVAAAAR